MKVGKRIFVYKILNSNDLSKDSLFQRETDFFPDSVRKDKLLALTVSL